VEQSCDSNSKPVGSISVNVARRCIHCVSKTSHFYNLL